jgi:hypothetical protein
LDSYNYFAGCKNVPYERGNNYEKSALFHAVITDGFFGNDCGLFQAGRG